jgi:hypothetical protein
VIQGQIGCELLTPRDRDCSGASETARAPEDYPENIRGKYFGEEFHQDLNDPPSLSLLSFQADRKGAAVLIAK